MKNLINETADKSLHGRLKYSLNFVDLKDVKGKSILDIGCGYGWCELDFLKKGAKKITATEISNTDLKTIRDCVTSSKVVTRVASAISLPFKNNTFDTIVSWEVLEHIPNATEQLMFSEAFRVLKKGGSFYLSTPSSHPVSKLVDPAFWLIGHRHYSKSQIQEYGSNAKLQLEKITVKGRIWESLGILNLYFSKWLLRRQPIFQEYIFKKIDQEYLVDGYIDLFAKFKK